MVMTDPIADMLTRIRNGLLRRHRTVNVPASRLKEGILAALKREGFIEDYRLIEAEPRGILRVYLKWGPRGERVIGELKRESTPGRRVYQSVTEIKPVLRGIGAAIYSTPQGILSDKECRHRRVGGELLCTVW
jgi:small subunit ribosomal protein S8